MQKVILPNRDHLIGDIVDKSLDRVAVLGPAVLTNHWRCLLITGNCTTKIHFPEATNREEAEAVRSALSQSLRKHDAVVHDMHDQIETMELCKRLWPGKRFEEMESEAATLELFEESRAVVAIEGRLSAGLDLHYDAKQLSNPTLRRAIECLANAAWAEASKPAPQWNTVAARAIAEMPENQQREILAVDTDTFAKIFLLVAARKVWADSKNKLPN